MAFAVQPRSIASDYHVSVIVQLDSSEAKRFRDKRDNYAVVLRIHAVNQEPNVLQLKTKWADWGRESPITFVDGEYIF